jgi:hypothetical protein
MTPYYADQWVSIYHSRWQDMLALSIEAAYVTDQPFGTGWVRGGGGVGEFRAKQELADWDRWDLSWMTAARAWATPRAIVAFAPNSRLADLRAAMPRPQATVWWRKTNPRPNGPDREPIVIWPATLPEGVTFSSYNGDTPFHPCQKPVDLMAWLLGFVDPTLIVVDPFAGSGSTLVAAKALGRRAIGIEISEEYCSRAAERCRQEVLDLGGVA